MSASPFPYGTLTLGQKLNNPKIDELQARQQQAPQPQPDPGPSSTPDAMNVAPQPLQVQHTHDIAGMDGGGGLAKPPVANTGAMTGKAKVGPIQPSPNEQALQGQYNKISSTGSGISQIKNPVGRGLLTALDAVGSGLFPRIAGVIPGTQAHHEELLHEKQGSLEHEQKNRLQTNQEQEQAARATDLESKPELAEAKNELGLEKLGESTRAHQATEDINKARYEGQNEARQTSADAALHRDGYRRTEDGGIEPIPPDEMSEAQRGNFDLRSAQTELAHANAQLKRAMATGDTAGQQLAQKRLELTAQRLQLMGHTSNRLDKQFEFRSQGTVGGVAPEGTPLSERGVPVGTANAKYVTPTTGEINKGDLAKSAVDRVASMKDILRRRPDLFGPGNGRITDLQIAIGNQDPEAQKFLADSKYLADHSAALFGGRGEYIQKSLNELNANKINVAALHAALDEAEKTAKPFAKAGERRTVGSDAVEHPSADPAVKAYADKYFGGDVGKAQSAIDSQKKK